MQFGIACMEFTPGPVPCSYHPDVLTGLRCNRCGRPICPLDAIQTEVGNRCPECAGVRDPGTIRTGTDSLLKASLAGFLVAVVIAALWRFFPAWQFYLALGMGFGVVETVAWATNNKRGRDLQLLSMGIITVGFVLSRFLLADRYNITLELLNNMSPAVARALQLQAIPDLVFLAIAYLIAWVRFR